MVVCNGNDDNFECACLSRWESYLETDMTEDEIKDCISKGSQFTVSSHPSCGFYTWVLGELAMKLRTLDEERDER